MHASVLRAAAVPWLPMSAGMAETGAVRTRVTEFAIMTQSLFSSWDQLKKLSSAVIYVDIPLGPVMGRNDRAKVMARLGWTDSEKQHLEAVLQGRWYETALIEIAPDVAVLADWHQTNWFTVQGAEKRAIHATGVRPQVPTADILFAFAFARFHRMLVERVRKRDLLPAILQGGSDGCLHRSLRDPY